MRGGGRWCKKGPLTRPIPVCLALLFWLALSLVSSGVAAQEPSQDETAPAGDGGQSVVEVPRLGSRPPAATLTGRIVAIEVVTERGRWAPVATPGLERVRLGEPFSVAVAQRAMQELLDRGRYADVRSEVEPAAGGVLLRLVVLPRRIVQRVRLSGSQLNVQQTLLAAAVPAESELTERELPEISARVAAFYSAHGYPRAQVETVAVDTDDPLRVVVQIRILAGAPQRVRERRFTILPDARVANIEYLVTRYAVKRQDLVDAEALGKADRELEERLRAQGWHRSLVTHRVWPAAGGGAVLEVRVDAGPYIEPRFEGNEHFDTGQLRRALELEEPGDRAPETLAGRLRDFYQRHGFLDVEVEAEERGEKNEAIHELLFRIRERLPVQVIGRRYPCLTGGRRARDLDREIDSFLSEELPGTGFFSPADPRVVDETYGPSERGGTRVAPRQLHPWNTYVPEVYRRALKHVQGLYRSEGYLSATVGPVQLLRRRCPMRSPPGQCQPIGPGLEPQAVCRYDELGVPLPEPAQESPQTCVSDPARGVTCELEAVVAIPIKLGPQTILYDVAFEGNEQLTESDLAKHLDLKLGDPVSQPDIDRARRIILDQYAEEGFVYAALETELDLSPDRTRGRVRFVISESKQVIVREIVIRGATRTHEGLIRRRIALTVGEPYRRSLVRKTEERLAVLGVFTNVTVSLEDSHVPAREKVVIVAVQERLPQSLEALPGLSSGDGPRVRFEYGHANIGGQAIQFRLRVGLNYLPDAFIIERDVREKFQRLQREHGVVARLERRLSASVEFPDIGLGPLFRLGLEGLAVRDNSRDYGLTRSAGLLTLYYRPTRRVTVQVGPSLEFNNAQVFDTEDGQKASLDDYVRRNPGTGALFRVPEGRSYAFAQHVSGGWDRRDNPLGATRGTFLSARLEHVRAVPTGRGMSKLLAFGEHPSPAADAGVFSAVTSQFVKFSNRMAGYVPLGSEGLALALSVGWGANVQLFSGSQTYPDRLFFLGGADSLRGFTQDSVVPEDVAQEVLAGDLGIDGVLVRGGDFYWNPRAELRVPLGKGPVQSALFLDTGNLWADVRHLRIDEVLDPDNLRYAVGAGIRVATPIGPLVFDYGFNVDRIMDELFPERRNKRYWESRGAFHFSIGTF